MTLPDKRFKALLFDCYGTLINWEAGMNAHTDLVLSPVGLTGSRRNDFFVVLGDLEHRLQAEDPTMLYPKVLEEAYRGAGKHFGLSIDNEKITSFGSGVGKWPAFVDSAQALKRLSDLGLKLCVLSNVDNASFAVTRQQLEKGFAFDGVYTAQDIGSFKPSKANFEYALAHLQKDHGVAKEDVLIVANSKLHDIRPGQAVGLQGAWINRRGGVMGVAAFKEIVPDWEFPDLDTFASVMEKVHGL